MLSIMRENGCYYVDVGFESGAQRVLDGCAKKRISLKDAEGVLKKAEAEAIAKEKVRRALERTHVDLQRRQLPIVEAKNDEMRVVPINDILYNADVWLGPESGLGLESRRG